MAYERRLLEYLFADGDRHRHHGARAVVDYTLSVVSLAVLDELSLAGAMNPANARRVVGFIAAFFLLASLWLKGFNRCFFAEGESEERA